MEKPLVTRLEISRLRMIVEDGPDASWYPAGACGFAVRRLAELDDARARFVLVETPEG